MKKILTIFIPTFQRTELLNGLLKMIVKTKKIDRLDIVVQNNNKHDFKTVNLLKEYKKKFPEWDFISNDSNIGAEKNIIKGLKKVKTKYCWIIGDDDLPMHGLIDDVLDLLMKNEIMLLFIKPFWTKNINIFKNKNLIHIFNNRSNCCITPSMPSSNLCLVHISSI